MATQKENNQGGSLAAKNPPASQAAAQQPSASQSQHAASDELAALRADKERLERENARLQEEKSNLASMAAESAGPGYRNTVGDGRTSRKGQKWPFKVLGRGKDQKTNKVTTTPAAVVYANDASEAIRLYCVHEPVKGWHPAMSDQDKRAADASFAQHEADGVVFKEAEAKVSIVVGPRGEVLAPQRNQHLDPSSWSFKADNLRQEQFASDRHAEYRRSWESRYPVDANGKTTAPQMPPEAVPAFA